ncbi:MAG TPA: hypothetical protein PKI03_28070 [Pseudomonadota bacterium]|nr:hypothetical protein [Pseudomonadota bacterium]
MDISAQELRRILDEVLPTDADLVAFCIDAELSARKRFADGMDRVARVNLILSLHKPDEVWAALRTLRPAQTASAMARSNAVPQREAAGPPHPAAPLSFPKRGDGSEERKLTIRLKRDGARGLRVGYYVPVYGLLAETEAGNLEEIEGQAPGLNYDGKTGLAAIHHLLNHGGRQDLTRILTGLAVTGEQGLGKLLYRLLFPSPKEEEHVLTHLLSESLPGVPAAPLRHAVTVRIWTSEPDFIGLPWRLTCWQGNLLSDHGWTFAVTPEPVDPLPVRLSPLSRVLVVAPQETSLGNLDTQSHIAELRKQLAAGLPAQGKEEWFRVVHDRAGLENALRSMPFDLLYYYGHGGMGGGQVQLVLGDGSQPKARLAPADLLRLFGDSPPKLVLLNACFGGAAGWQSAGYLLSPKIPVVVCSLTTEFTHFAGALAIRFLKGVLLDRRDPVELLHQRDPSDPAQTQADFQWATHAVFARYTSWEPTPIEAQRHDPRNPLRLDRTIARAQVIEQVSALLEGSKRRVEALVAYGHERSLVERFSAQATDHLERRRIAPVATLSLRFPQARTDLYKQLSEDFLQQVTRKGEPLQHALRRHAPQVRTAGKPVLWLDWGVCGDGAPQDKLNLEQLRCWLKWSSEFLCRDCPDDLRIVSFMALRRPLTKYELLENEMEKFKEQLGSERFRAWLLTPLPRVRKGEIKDYLSDPDLCSCAENTTMVDLVAELIYRDTDGHYEQVVAHIEWAEKHGWQSLIDVLRQQHEPSPKPTESEDI